MTELREVLGSNRALGEILGVSTRTVQMWAFGHRNPSAGIRRLVWLVWMLHFHPRKLRDPLAWLRWPCVRETELEARIKAAKVRPTPQQVVDTPKDN
jgi:hypothetical protein